MLLVLAALYRNTVAAAAAAACPRSVRFNGCDYAWSSAAPTGYSGCGAGEKPGIGGGCVCSAGRYNRSAYGDVACFDGDFSAEALGYAQAQQAGQPACASCAGSPCLDCDQDGDGVVAVGWRDSPASAAALDRPDATRLLFRCEHTGACPGGNASSACAGDFGGSALCAECERGYYQIRYDRGAGRKLTSQLTTRGRARCQSCANRDGQGSVALGTLAFCVIVVLPTLLSRAVRFVRSADIGFVTSLTMVVGFLQVSAIASLMIELDMEATVPWFGRLMSTANLVLCNVRDMTSSIACSELGFLVVWLVRVMLIPVLLPALGIVGGLVAARGFVSRAPPRAVLAKICNTPRDVRWLFAQARLTVFIFYPSVTYEIFSVFDCRSLGEESYLASSMTTSCGKVGSSMSGSYYLSLLLALALAAAWTVGVPVGMALYARSKMKALEGEFSFRTSREMRLSAADSTLTVADMDDKEYHVAKWRSVMLEAFDLLRKAVFTGFLLFVDAHDRAAAGATCSMLFFALHCRLWSYDTREHNLLKAAELGCTFLVYLVGQIGAQERLMHSMKDSHYFLALSIAAFYLLFFIYTCAALYRSYRLDQELSVAPSDSPKMQLDLPDLPLPPARPPLGSSPSLRGLDAAAKAAAEKQKIAATKKRNAKAREMQAERESRSSPKLGVETSFND